MSTSLNLEPESLLEAVSQLPNEEFEQFLCRVVALRGRSDELPNRESELLLKITQGLPAKTWEEYQMLREKKEKDELAPEDEQRIFDVVERLENHTADRVRWLSELAGLRNQSVTELMRTLEIEPNHG
jgi:hypothetical protein